MDRRFGRWFGGRTRRNADADTATPLREAAASAPEAVPVAGHAQAAATDPTVRAMSPEELQLQTGFVRILDGRCDVLLRAATAETRQSDAQLVMDCLRKLDGTVIRQPPLAAQRALAVIRNPMSSAQQLVAIFEQDPALTEALLRMANSSFYHRGSEPVVSIPQAIKSVGVRGIESIVTTHMIEGMLCRPGSAYSMLLGKVWGHMMRTAPIARSLAPAFGAAPETAFTVGLLHDVGKLLVFDYLSQLRARHMREIRLPERFLLDMLNRLHEPLGGIAALRWKLGASVAQSIACHHHEPPPEAADLLSELLCVSERAEHASQRAVAVDLERIWREGECTADRTHVAGLLAEYPGITVAQPRTKRAA